MQAPRYSLLQANFSTKSYSKALAADLLLTLWHRPRCLKYYQPCISCRHQPWIPAVYYSLIFSLWYPVLAVIHEKRCEFSISWAIRAYKLVYLLDVTLKKDQKTWLSTCNSAWFWGICYSAKPSHPVYSFGAWLPYYDLVSEALVYSASSACKLSLTLGAWRTVLPRFLILSKD